MSYRDEFCADRVIIEDDVTVSYRATFACHGPGVSDGLTVLCRGCYIGMSATIVGPVEVGALSVVGAGAVVVKDVPAMTVVVGVPAKVIKRLDGGVQTVFSEAAREG